MSQRATRPSLLRRIRHRLVHRGWAWVQANGMVTAASPAGRRFRRFGPGSSLSFPPGPVFGEAWIEIGTDTVIGERVALSAGLVPGHDLGPEPVVRIGDRCSLGRGSHVVGHLSIEIGDDVFAGPYVYITDQNHGYADPDVPIGRQWPRNAAVRIGSGSWLGTGAVILPGASLGRNVVVAAGAVVRGTFPDHCVVAGAPARIVRRYVPGRGWEPALRGLPTADADLGGLPAGLLGTAAGTNGGSGQTDVTTGDADVAPGNLNGTSGNGGTGDRAPRSAATDRGPAESGVFDGQPQAG